VVQRRGDCRRWWTTPSGRDFQNDFGSDLLGEHVHAFTRRVSIGIPAIGTAGATWQVTIRMTRVGDAFALQATRG
jgi:hypothetical protein